MGRLIHCLGMFVRDKENARRRRKQRDSEVFDPERKAKEIAGVTFFYGMFITIIVLAVTSLF